MATAVADTPAGTLTNLDALQATQIQQIQAQAAQQLAQQLAQIRGEMSSRGLSGSSFEQQALVAAQKASDDSVNSSITQIQTTGAQEQLGVESQQSQQEFQAQQDAAQLAAQQAAAKSAAQGGLFGNLTALGAAYIGRNKNSGGAPGPSTAGGNPAYSNPVPDYSNPSTPGGNFVENTGSPGGTAGSPSYGSLFSGGFGQPLANGAASSTAGKVGQAAGAAGGLFAGGSTGQLIGKSLYGKDYNNNAVSRGVKVGSLAGAGIGTYFGGPLGGEIGGAVGGAVGGPVGKAVGWVGNEAKKLFCFLPDTPIEMYGDKVAPIGQLRLGDVTLGGIVWSIRRSLSEDLFDYQGIKVTGSHAVKEDGRWIRVEDSALAVPIMGQFEVVSIVTDRHRVYSMGVTLADEHESDDYETLSIDESLARLNEEEARHGA